MEQTFEEYLKQARWDFAKVAEKYPVEKHLELRTAIDSLLIAYDQAVHQALSLADVVGKSEQLKRSDNVSGYWDEREQAERCDWIKD